MMPQDLERQATSKPSAKANKQNQVAPTNRRMQSRAQRQLNSRHAIQRQILNSHATAHSDMQN